MTEFNNFFRCFTNHLSIFTSQKKFCCLFLASRSIINLFVFHSKNEYIFVIKNFDKQSLLLKITFLENYNCRTGRLRQYEASYGLSRGRLGRMRCRSGSLSRDYGGPRRAGSPSITPAVAPTEFSSRTSTVSRVVGCSTYYVDVYLFHRQ